MNIPLARAEKWADPLTNAMADGKIDTRLRIAAFLAQIGHETQGLQYVKELGGPTYFSKYDGREDPVTLLQIAEVFAAIVFGEVGDGARFPGRGLIQVTGRANYLECSMALFGDDRLINKPELLEEPVNAAASAVWFWNKKGLNKLADASRITDMTRKINGGLNGLQDRLSRWQKALAVMPV